MRHAEAYTVLFDGFVRRLCATASRDDSLPLLALHRRRWRSGASDLLVHAARDGAARGRLRAFAGGLLGRAEGAGAVGPPAELDADAALNLGPRRGHEEEERGDGEDGCDAVQGGSSGGGGGGGCGVGEGGGRGGGGGGGEAGGGRVGGSCTEGGAGAFLAGRWAAPGPTGPPWWQAPLAGPAVSFQRPPQHGVTG